MLRYLVGFIVMALSLKAFSASEEISQTPVIVSTGVKPNIMLILDDSGSMDWEDTLNKGVENLKIDENIKLKPTSSYLKDAKIYNEEKNSWKVFETKKSYYGIEPEKINTYARLATCAGFNVLAYDEEKKYVTPPQQQNISKKKINQLSNLFYYRWIDGKSSSHTIDGKYNIGECGFEGEYKVEGDELYYIFNKNHLQKVSELSLEKKINYAKWFYYYRDRIKIAKVALSNVVFSNSGRIGLNTLHKRNEQIVEDVEKNNHREKVINSIFAVETQGGTPLRSTLKRVGEYFKGIDSPILSAKEGGMCQQNFTILMSDGYWNGSDPGVGNQDGIFGGLVRKSDSDNYSNTLADVAMKYYKEDLKTNLVNLVPIVQGVDENTAQHLVTHTVSFGVDGKLTENPSESDKEFKWPEPVKDALTTIDDMRHAAWNSRGQFLSAADPNALNIALNSIIQNISARSASTSSLEIGGKGLSSSNILIQAIYDPTNWKGDVIARSLDNVKGSDIEWFFSQWLKDLENRHLKRQILTINPQVDTDQAFAFTADHIDKMSPVQQRDLFGSDPDKLSLEKKKELIDYLKGDAQYEGSKFRVRSGNYIGDIVNSNLKVVGSPLAIYPNSIADGSYAAFRKKNQNRPEMVYVGANDGMLHAINLESGAEKFAFIPHGVFGTSSEGRVRQLTSKEYVHRFYVNATPVAQDAYVKMPGETEKSWHTLLTGGLGAGGKSVYLLNITNPENFAAASPGDIVKWEFSHDDLGYSFSEVQIVKLADDKWYATFGNGYSDNDNTISDGKAKLFIVDIEDPSKYALIDTGVGSSSDTSSGSGTSGVNTESDRNGLSSPEVADLNGDGVVDWIYAGDIHGNLWTFDLTGFDGQVSSVTTKRLFQSCAGELASGECPSEFRQPITTKPALARNTHFSASKDHPNVNVFWGTGQLLFASDKSDTSQQTFYSVLHRNDGLSPKRRDLIKHAFTEIGNKDDARTVNGTRVNYTDTSSKDGIRLGWYLPLTDSGERLITTPAIRGDLVIFNTTVPMDGGLCVASAQGWANAVSLLDGLTPQRVGTNNQVFDYNRNGGVNSEDNIGSSTVLSIKIDGEPTAPKFDGNAQYVGLGASQSASGGVLPLLMNFGDTERAGRSGWFQLR